MAIRRRQFLLAGVAWFAVPAGRSGLGTRYLSAAADTSGGHHLAGLDAAGKILFRTRLPARAHAVAVNPRRRSCIVAARRPGRYLLELSLDTGRILARADAAPGRHFYGHGTFSPDGRRLYASENDYEGERGVIGVYSVNEGLRRLGEMPSHGIGPHELKLAADGRTLVVANGGILTHPDTGRSKLNLHDMRPKLAYLDRHDGSLLESVELPPELRQLSIRHLDTAADGRVAFAMQYQGPAGDAVPLVAVHARGRAASMLALPETQRRAMRQYCGSVRFDRSGRWLAVSAPRGDRVQFFRGDGRYAGHVSLGDGCGIAPGVENGEFLLSSGQGRLVRFNAETAELSTLAAHPNLHWDNHMEPV